VTGPAAEHFRLEDELTTKLAAALKVHLAGGTPAPTAPPVPAGPSQTDYVVALGHLERYDDPASVKKAVDLLRALPNADTSAPIQAALGRALLYVYRDTHEIGVARLAQAAAEKAQRLDPGRTETLLTLGAIKAAQGRYEEAIQDFRHVLERDPHSVDALLALGDALADAGKRTEAEAAYTKAATTRPGYWAPYNRLGALHYQRGAYGPAITAYEEAVRQNPTGSRPLSNLTAAYVQAGRLEDALKTSQEAIALQPSASGWSNLGIVHYYAGRFGDATAAFEKAVALAPKRSTPRVNLADALRWSGADPVRVRTAYSDTLASAEDELKINPKSVTALRNEARAFAALGEEARAREAIRAARAAAPDDSSVLVVASIAALRRQDRAGALALVDEAVRLGFSPALLKADPDLAPLRGDPLFEKALSAPRPPGAQ